MMDHPPKREPLPCGSRPVQRPLDEHRTGAIGEDFRKRQKKERK